MPSLRRLSWTLKVDSQVDVKLFIFSYWSHLRHKFIRSLKPRANSGARSACLNPTKDDPREFSIGLPAQNISLPMVCSDEAMFASHCHLNCRIKTPLHPCLFNRLVKKGWLPGLVTQEILQSAVSDPTSDGCLCKPADRALGLDSRNVQRKMLFLFLWLIFIKAHVAVSKLVTHHKVNRLLLCSHRDVKESLCFEPTKYPKLSPVCVGE